MKNYNELIVLKTFDERLDYLRLFSNVCENTFGGNRYFNQKFYMSEEWKKIRKAQNLAAYEEAVARLFSEGVWKAEE